ncbi:MAG: iron transporter [Halanaeroarchaeum sp.]
MNRRSLLTGAGTAGVAALAGCSSLLEWRSTYAPPVVEDRPSAPYIPSHVEEMATIGSATAGPIECSLSYTYPHRFWLVTGSRTERVSIASGDSVHLMATVRDRESGIVQPDASPSIRVRVGGEQVARVNPWPMLSQPMGFHFGDNVTLPGGGRYEVDVSVAPPTTPRHGAAFDDREGPVTCTVPFEYARDRRDALAVKKFPERKGERGALEPMGMRGGSKAPAVDALPGRTLGTARSGSAVLAATVLDDATAFGGSASQGYLAVSARTPHNRYVLPAMSLSASLGSEGSGSDPGPLDPGIHPELSVHYGTIVDDPGTLTDLSLRVTLPPQIARHEGYETAFLEMSPVELTA